MATCFLDRFVPTRAHANRGKPIGLVPPRERRAEFVPVRFEAGKRQPNTGAFAKPRLSLWRGHRSRPNDDFQNQNAWRQILAVATPIALGDQAYYALRTRGSALMGAECASRRRSWDLRE